VKWLAVQKNSDGRPCGWGLSTNREQAVVEARRQYEKHECYLGERKGKLEVTEIEDETPSPVVLP
jgi:hypothetical protein